MNQKPCLFVSRTDDTLIINKLTFQQPAINFLSKKGLLLEPTVMKDNLYLDSPPSLLKPAVVGLGGGEASHAETLVSCFQQEKKKIVN